MKWCLLSKERTKAYQLDRFAPVLPLARMEEVLIRADLTALYAVGGLIQGKKQLI